MSKNPKYCIFGYFGFHNIGDDLMLLNALNYLDNNFKNSRFYVFVKEDYYSNFSKINTYDNIQVKYIKISPFVNRVLMFYYAFISQKAIWIGGTCLYETEYSGISGLNWLHNVMLKFKYFKKDFSFCNIGVGDFITIKGRNLYIKIVNDSNEISCRDEVSLAKLQKDFEFEKKSYAGGDLACLLENKIVKSQSKNVIFCGHFQYHDNDQIILKYSSALNGLAKDGYQILFLPMHQGEQSDNIFHAKIAQKLEFTHQIIEYLPGDVYKHFENACAVISMRLHGLVLADILGIPNIGIAYHEKVSTYINNTGILGTLRSKKVGENIGKEDLDKVIEQYKRPESFLLEEKKRANNGMKVFNLNN